MRALLVIAASLVIAAPALAWQPIYSTRPVWRPPVPYSIHNAGSADLGFATSETEARRAMEEWTLVACTSLTTTYRGATASRPGTYDGVSVIGWVESGWDQSSSAIGVTGPRWSSNIIEADMELNGVNYRWVTGPGSGGNVNTYSIVLHEGGHYYGLGHSDVSGSSMWPSYGGGVIGLGADDRAGICALYPGTGPSDCTVTGCPSGQECVGGACTPITGDGSLCSPCARSSDCVSGSYCLGYPDGAGYCGQSCTASSQCGTNGRCVNTTAGAQCVRLVDGSPSCAATAPSGCGSDSDCETTQRCNLTTRACEARPTTGAALGQPCAADSECQSALCLGGACTQSCNWLTPTSCPSGFYCDGDLAASCDVGYCRAGAAGAGALGASCTGDTECSSLFCDGGTCSQPCLPGGAVGCPNGYACQVGTLPCRGACRASGALGDQCETNDDCTSSICAAEGDLTYCTQLCDPTSVCPNGFTCTPVGDISVCRPDRSGLGQDCTGNEECLSGICATEGSRSYCTRLCDDGVPCPERTFTCELTTDGVTRVCRPTTSGPAARGGCGCRVVAPGRGSFAALGVALAGALWLRRRRRG